jgi:RNA polymerase sigma-70 factor (ECF subfamily)
VEERAAIERLKRGDIGGLEALVRKYHTRAGRAAYLIVRDHALAENVAQDAFVRAYERFGQFDDGRPFGPWFMRIVINEAIGAARRRERTTSYRGGDVAASMEQVIPPQGDPRSLDVRVRRARALTRRTPCTMLHRPLELRWVGSAASLSSEQPASV